MTKNFPASQRLIRTLLLISCLGGGQAYAAPAAAAASAEAQPKLVVVLVVDGLPSEQVQRYRDQFGQGGGEQHQAAWREQLAFLQNSVGAIAGPFDSFLALRGVKTLDIRMERHCRSALELATWLQKQPEVRQVYYPGLPSHPQHELALRQMDGFGGIISIELKTDLAGARRFLERCQVFALAESLGGVESLIEHPAIMTHATIPAEQRAMLGITDAFIRLSVGIEDVEDLRADLRRALDAIQA